MYIFLLAESFLVLYESFTYGALRHRDRGKGKKLTVTNHKDLGSGEEEKITTQKKRGRTQKPLKDEKKLKLKIARMPKLVSRAKR